MRPRVFQRIVPAAAAVLAVSLWAALPGCQAPWMKKKKEAPELPVADDLEPDLEFVGDLTRAWGLGYMKVESIALVTRLRATGSDPPPSDRRESLRMDMKANGVAHPDDILALDSTAMVYVKAFYPPGARQGQRCDLIVESPPRTETTSLRDGWLMHTRLRPVEVLGNRLRQGKVLGSAAGPVIIDATFQGQDDAVNLVRGRVLGGGVCQIDRPIGLVVNGENHSLMTSTHVAAAVNRRFFTFDHGRKTGVAVPKDDDYIELMVNATYRHNLGRYVRVVRSIAVHETAQQRIERLGRLEGLLLEPISCARTALRLEAMGAEALPVLSKGLQSADPEVRFCAAEAIAYVHGDRDQRDAEAPPEALAILDHAARDSRAFRWRALAALSVIKDAAAYEVLTQLLHAPGVETRIGALRALQTRSTDDPLTRGEWLSEPNASSPVVKLVVVASPQEPLVHFMRYREPEVAIFAHELRLKAPFSVFAGKEIIVKSIDARRVKLSRFTPGEDERRLECSTRLDDVVRAIVALGGGYADVLQAVREAQQAGALAARIEVNALPSADRKYDRSSSSSDDAGDSGSPNSEPIPELFYDRGGDDPRDATEEESDWSPENEEPPPGMWRRMKKWVYPG
jgi:flagellar basal body P-ring protein FlgI